MNLKNHREWPDCTPLCLAMYMDVHKEGTGHLSPFGGKREGRSSSGTSRTSYWGSTIGICECLDALVHIPAQLREKLSPRQPLLSFLDMLSPGIDAMTWNPRDSMYPWMFSLMGSPHIFLNLIKKPRGRMVMEMYCGLLLFINSNLILLQLMLRISLTLQASSFAQHLLPIVSLFSWPQRIPVTRHSMFLLGGDYSLFPRVRLLQKIRSDAQSLYKKWEDISRGSYEGKF